MVHGLQDVLRAADIGQAGGSRVIGRCRCGWHTRAALTASLAVADLADHIELAASNR